MTSVNHLDHAAPFYGEETDARLRVPPYSLDAEQAVLGGLMIAGNAGGRAWWDVCDVLTAGDFYRRDHQLIWSAIEELAKRERPFDVVTIGDAIQAQGKLEVVGDGAYLLELATTTPSAANIRAYAEIVAEKARLRRMIQVGTELVNDAFNPGGRSSVELIGEAQSRIGGLLDSEPCDLEPVAPVMQRVFERLEQRSRAEVRVHGLPTGITDLDSIIGGLLPGGLYVLAARPKMGKTTLALNIAEHCALVRKQPVAAFSFEMQPEEWGDRMLASVGNVDSGRIRSGDLDDVDWTNITAAMKRLRGAEIFVSRPRNARVEHVIAQTRRQHARTPLGLVVIDYLQLMTVVGDNRAQGIGDITRALKLMAGELQVPVLLLSQLNRDLEKRPDKRPIVSDLRDSGSIEQDADAVIFIYRDEVYDKHSRWKGTAELIVGVQRNGPSGDCRVLYMPERFKFQDLPEYWQPAPIATDDEKPTARPRGFRRTAAAAREDVA